MADEVTADEGGIPRVHSNLHTIQILQALHEPRGMYPHLTVPAVDLQNVSPGG